MSATSFLVVGDNIMFDVNLSGGLAILVPPIGVQVSSTAKKTTAAFRKPALLGDEMQWVPKIPPCQYLPTGYAVPGMVKVEMMMLNLAGHISKKVMENGVPVLLVGSPGTKFNLIFTVNAPAKLVTPAGTVDDPVPMYTGTGYFMQLMDSKSSQK